MKPLPEWAPRSLARSGADNPVTLPCRAGKQLRNSLELTVVIAHIRRAYLPYPVLCASGERGVTGPAAPRIAVRIAKRTMTAATAISPGRRPKVSAARRRADHVDHGVRWQASRARQHLQLSSFSQLAGAAGQPRLVDSCRRRTGKPIYDTAMAIDHRDRRSAERVRCPDRWVLIASAICRGCTTRASGVEPWDARFPSACRPGAASCWRPNHRPAGPWLFTRLRAGE